MGEEIADVLVFGLLFCHEAGLDPFKAIGKKLRTNAKKYRVRLARGRALKYTELQKAKIESAKAAAKGSQKHS